MKKKTKNQSTIVLYYRQTSDILDYDNNGSLYQFLQEKYQNQDILISCENQFCRYGETISMIKDRFHPQQLEFRVHEFNELFKQSFQILKYEKEIQGFVSQIEQIQLAMEINKNLFNDERLRLQTLLEENNINYKQNKIMKPKIISVEDMNPNSCKDIHQNISNNSFQILINEKELEIERLVEKSRLFMRNRQSQILKQKECQFCLSNIEKNEKSFSLSCNHFFHDDCLKDQIQAQIIQKRPILICNCGVKIKKSHLQLFDQLYAQQTFHQLHLNQILILKSTLSIMECENKFCYFFCINDGISLKSYCPICLV